MSCSPEILVSRTLSFGAAVAVLLLAGCASVSPDKDRAALDALIGSNPLTAGAALPVAPMAASTTDAAASGAPHAKPLAGPSEPLTQEAAVRLALVHSPRAQQALAALQLSDAERAQAASLPNPVLAFSRLREGRELELERSLRISLLGLLTLPWQAKWADQRHEAARLQAALELLQLAAQTRRAWLQAVAAQQGAQYLRDAREATEAGAQLGQRMVKAGNWSALQSAREQLALAEADALLARAQQSAVASREQLLRLLGLQGEAAVQLRLPDRLPALPEALPSVEEVQVTALRDRVDLRAAQAQRIATAEAMGLTRVTRVVNAMEIGASRNTTFANDADRHRSTQRGWELELPIPLFDWGQARGARAEALYLQAAARLRATAVQAASEAREADAARRSAWQVARRYQREVLPLRRQVNDEMVLRYNAMSASVWELLAETRASSLAVHAAMQAQRDYWLADTDLQLAISGTSPAGIATLGLAQEAGPAASESASAAH